MISVNKYLRDWAGSKFAKKKNLTLEIYKWYFDTYRRIYSNINNKNLLKDQNNSLSKRKHSVK